MRFFGQGLRHRKPVIERLYNPYSIFQPILRYSPLHIYVFLSTADLHSGCQEYRQAIRTVMLLLKFTIARLSLVTCLCFSVQAATLPGSRIADPTAIATNADANYCFARVRGLDPGRLPPAYLVLQLKVRVSYRNNGTRPLILPLERERIVYTALKPGAMSVFHGAFSLLEPAYNAMKDLPADVSAENPVSPANDVFTVIPPGGEMTPPLMEQIAIPVNRKSLFKREPDLRGHKLYVRLKFAHRELSAALEASLSDRWARFGVPWTGTLTTNTFVIDVPRAPQGLPCKDTYQTTGIEPHIDGK
jgi:hypothetical protein